jgi:sulfur relay (sulfurtransferase) DsrC/TusE family protein
LEKLKEFCESLPHGIQSGLQKGFKGIFFYYKYNEEYHLWFLYDVANNRFITNKTEILQFISCKENEPRIIPEDLDIFEIHRRVREKIKEFFSEGLIATQIRTIHGRMEKTLTDMRDELDFIKENYLEEEEPLRERITSMITNLNNIALTKLRMRTLRRIWKNYKHSKNWNIMLKELDKFLREKPVNEVQEVVKFDERRLKLICVDFIS